MKLLVQWRPDPNTVANCKQVPDDFPVKDVPDGWELLGVKEFESRAKPFQDAVTAEKLERIEAERAVDKEYADKIEAAMADPVTKTEVSSIDEFAKRLEARLAAIEAKLGL